MEGIEKTVDELGRVVIPIEFRNKLGIKKQSKINMSLNNNEIIISAIENSCVICHKERYINDKIKVCAECAQKIKNII